MINSFICKKKKPEKHTSKKCINPKWKRKFNLDLYAICNNEKTEKRFDFVFIGAMFDIYACECIFYGSPSSKLNETARSYKNLTLESKNIFGFNFVWFTDGTGWNTAKHNLEETFDVLNKLHNLNDIKMDV